jgi:hypothetical protein
MVRLAISQAETIQIGRILHNSLLRDKSDFESFSPVFADPFAANFLININGGASLLSIQTMNADRKVITNRIHSNMGAFRADMSKIAALLRLSNGTLTIANEDFGVSEVRASINGYKVPEFMSSIGILITNIKANIKPLNATGLTVDYISDLENRAMAIAADDVLRRKMNSQKGQVIRANWAKILEINEAMQLIMESGKAIYKITNPARAKDYTLSALKHKHHVAPTTTPVAIN